MEEKTLSRSWRIVGGLFMNLALGTLYAWSVFVAPLEKEFGWKRADTSLVFTLAVVVFAISFVVAGRLQDKLGPLRVSLDGLHPPDPGLLSLHLDLQPDLPLSFASASSAASATASATRRPFRSWPSGFPTSAGWPSVSRSPATAAVRPSSGPWRKSGSFPTYGWRATLSVLGVVFFVMTMIGALLLEEPPAGYRPRAGRPAPAAKAAATTSTSPPARCGGRRPSTSCGSPTRWGTSAGLMVISQLVPFAKSVNIPSEALATMHSGRRRRRQCLRPHLLRLDVRPPRPPQRAAHHDRHLDGRHAGALRCRRPTWPCCTSWCSSSTGATARSSPSTPSRLPTSGAPRTPGSTTASCSRPGAWPASSAPHRRRPLRPVQELRGRLLHGGSPGGGRPPVRTLGRGDRCRR